MLDLIPLLVYLVCLAGLMWMHYKKIVELEDRLDAQDRILASLWLALHMHLDGKAVSMHMVPIRTDEEE